MKAGRILTAGLAAIGVLASASCSAAGQAATPTATRLVGLFRLAPGACTTATAKPSGSYLIVVAAAASHAVPNPKSGCVNHDYTLLRPGTAGGLVTGRFQPQPTPVFDANRDSRAATIIRPAGFGRFRFGFATESRDEQDAPTGMPAFPTPQAMVSNGTLNVDLRSLVLSYAGPAAGTCATSFGLGCWQLGSKSASGTYDARTHQFVIDWFSGESFTPKGDSIEVHLTGSFVPQNRMALVADRGLVTSLPAALAEVPAAASAATGGRLSPRQVRALLRTTTSVRSLANAIESPTSATATLTSSYRDAIAGRAIGEPDRLTATLTYLQTVEGEVVPAIRLAALRAGRPLSAGAAFAAVAAQRQTPELARLVGSWPQVYGALVLLEQQAAE